MIDEARAALRAIESLSAVVDRYRETMEKMEADAVRMTRSIDDMNTAAQEREHEITNLNERLARYFNKFAPSEIDILLDIRAGKIVCHALPASLEEAIGEAAALIDEARERCKPAIVPVVGMHHGVYPVRRWGESDADFSNRVAMFEANMKKRESTKPVGDMVTEQQTNEADFRNPLYELPPIWNPASETKEAFANRRHAYDERQTGKRAAMAVSMPVSPKVERKIEVDLMQAEHYASRAEEPYNTKAEDEDFS